MKIKDLLTKIGTGIAGTAVKTATAGVVDIEDFFDEDAEVEEEQLLQLISIRKHLVHLQNQNSIIIKQNSQLVETLHTLTSMVRNK